VDLHFWDDSDAFPLNESIGRRGPLGPSDALGRTETKELKAGAMPAFAFATAQNDEAGVGMRRLRTVMA
jgi:hypothetical protein